MTKHNALRMLGRSGNPTLSDATFAGFETVEAKTMTLQGTVNKVGILLALVVGGALFTWNQYYSHRQRWLLDAGWFVWRHDLCGDHHVQTDASYVHSSYLRDFTRPFLGWNFGSL